MTPEELFEAQKKSVLDGNKDEARKHAQAALDQGADLLACIENGYGAGIREVGDLWEEGEYFLPELVQGADAMKAAMEVIQPALKAKQQSRKLEGTVVIGTVAGDIHDIGKTLVGTFLEANGFKVIDLGKDVPLDRFVEVAEKEGAELIGLSSLLTTTMTGHKIVVDRLEEKKLRAKIGVLVGGAPVTPEYAKEINADGYGANAVEALNEALRIVKSR
jgi:corrinoid protein of di/trimethylamine methyltransferase